MKLTGKCKKDFEKWLLEVFFNRNQDIVKTKPTISEKLRAISFPNTEPSMQYGVYVDFFLENKILIEVKPTDHWDDWAYEIHLEDAMAPFFLAASSLGLESITEARTKAILKANEIYNEGN